MVRIRFTIGIIWVTILVLAHAIWTYTQPPPFIMPPARAMSNTTISGWRWHREPAARGRAIPRLDLHGNEIEDAIRQYRIDSRGDVYDPHAPGRVVDRLPRPEV